MSFSRARQLAVIAGMVAVIAVCWWPGDAKWINDEPALIYRAWEANQQGRLGNVRLVPGASGVNYHVIGIWFYQPFLLLTHDPVLISLLKTLLTTVATWGAALLLCRYLRYPPWLALLAILTPLPYYGNRLLWDNVQLIPLGLWLGVCLADMTRHRRWRGWYGGLLIGVWMFHIHLMAAPIIIAWLLAVWLANARWLRQHVEPLLGGAIAAALLTAPYAWSTLLALLQRQGEAPTITLLQALGTGLGGWRSFTAWPILFLLPELLGPYAPAPPVVIRIIAWSGWLLLPLVVIGATDQLRPLIRQLRAGAALPPRRATHLFMLAALLLSVGMFLVMRVEDFPHYYHGIWFAWLYLLWSGIRRLWRYPVGKVLTVLPLALTTLLLLIAALFVHYHGGTRSIYYGSTLSTQVAVVRTALTYPRLEQPYLQIQVDHQNPRHVQHSISTLLTLLRPSAPAPVEPPSRIRVRNRQDLAPISGALTVEAEPLPEAE